jgi:tetratricopeptide (TPR) repeat protein
MKKDDRSSSRALSLLRQYESAEEWKKAVALVHRLLKSEPDDHWLLTRLASSYYEARDYKSALAFSAKALKIAPRCPLAIWDHACALHMLGRRREAIELWRRLLRRNLERLAFGTCGEGMRWAESLQNDCRYRIGIAYLNESRHALARRFIVRHLELRRAGLPSLYTRREVLRKLALTELG